MNVNLTAESVPNLLRSLDPGERHSVNEYCTRAIAQKIIKKGDVVLDLGANEGFHTFNMASLVGPSGQVHAFEPNPAHWTNLLNKTSIRLWPMAVGDQVSVENFYLPVEHSHHQVASLVNPTDYMGSVEMRVLTVPQVTIDCIDEICCGNVTFVKMDIERREFFCIRGMRKMLQKSRPVIVFENNTSDIEALLSEVGYSVRGLILDADIDALPNVVAIPEERISYIKSISLNTNEFLDIIRNLEPSKNSSRLTV
jgi:FkbM family methyltransferase